MVQAPSTDFKLTGTHRKIRSLIGRMQMLKHGQILRRYYSPSSADKLWSWLAEMTRQGELVKETLPSRRTGNPPAAWHLSERAWRTLQHDGELVVPRPNTFHAENTVRHLFALNDVYISAELLAERHADRVQLIRARHESELASPAPRVEIATNAGVVQRQAVIPDLWLQLMLAKPTAVWVEVDLDTESRASWEAKLERIIRFVTTPDYQAYFDVPYFRLAVVIGNRARDEIELTDEGRLRKRLNRVSLLLAWTERVLLALEKEGLDSQEWARRLFFTTTDPASLPPADFFGGAIWSHPFFDQLTPLLEGLV